MRALVYTPVFRRRRLGGYTWIRDAVEALRAARQEAGAPHEGHIKAEVAS
jgi:hypothetical protein